MHFTKKLIAVSAAAIAVAGIVSAPAQAQKKVTYLLPAPAFVPAFAPWMIAKQKGYYAAEGLDVTFQRAKGGVDVAKQVGVGNAQIGGGIGDTSILVRPNGIPVRSVGLMGGGSLVQLVARADRGINKVEDLKGKTISSDITKSFTYTNTVVALGEAGAVNFNEFWPELKKTDPIVEFRTEPKMQMLISCQRPFDMWNLSGRVYQNVLKAPDLKDKIKIGSYSEGQVLLGNQMAVLKGAPNPNAGKLLAEFLMSKEGSDIFVEGEAIYSLRDGYTPPAATAPYLLDLSKAKLVGMKDWVAAQGDFKKVRSLWQENFR